MFTCTSKAKCMPKALICLVLLIPNIEANEFTNNALIYFYAYVPKWLQITLEVTTPILSNTLNHSFSLFFTNEKWAFLITEIKNKYYSPRKFSAANFRAGKFAARNLTQRIFPRRTFLEPNLLWILFFPCESKGSSTVLKYML